MLISTTLLVLASCDAGLRSSDIALGSQNCLTLSEPAESGGVVTSPPARVSFMFRVDTCSGEPVAGLDVSAFRLFEDSQPMSDFESQRRITTKGQRFRMLSVILLDMSGSMLRSGEFPELQIAAARYIETVLAEAGDTQRIALMTFDGRSEAQMIVGFTSDGSKLLHGLDALSISECRSLDDCAGFADRKSCAGWRCVDDSTNLNGAVISSLTVLEHQLSQESVSWTDGALIMFTDGTDQAARVSSEEAFSRVNSSKTHIFSIGLGGEVDEASLRAIGRDGYWPVGRAEKLQETFEQVASRVQGLANRFYLLEYCSPKRSGIHSLKVSARMTARDGSEISGHLSRDFDATGFSSGCSL